VGALLIHLPTPDQRYWRGQNLLDLEKGKGVFRRKGIKDEK
jgi:hypothetical protein